MNNVLRVDLNTGDITTETLEEKTCRKYLGGSALASYFLLRELKPGIDPLGPENVLVFTCSILNGVPLPGLSRYTVASKSPLTNGFGEAEAGGWWAPEIRKAGFIAIIVKGSSKEPVYLWINNGKVELRSAAHLKGKNTGDVEKIIREELKDDKIRVAQCGPAGENLVRYACILNNVKHANGRTGMGAVMGSKNLRAIAVRGTGKVPVLDKDKITDINRWFGKNWKDNPADKLWHEHGSAVQVEGLNASGMLPTRNFQTGVFEEAGSITGQVMSESILIKREGCFACPIHCKRIVEVKGKYEVDPYYGGPEYETIAALGSNCGVGDLEAIAKANELCNKYGLDTISTGVVISFAMECYERGIITDKDTGGIKLKFGNAEAMLKIIEMIKDRNGIGNVLAEGVARAADKLGKDAKKYALHIKGQELPLQDPRGKTGVAIGYAISPTGADHLEASHDSAYGDYGNTLDNVSMLGILEPVDPLELSPKKLRLFSYLQLINSLYNSIGMCILAAGPAFTLPLEKLVEITRAVTGWRTSLWELLKVGERANTMARCFNIREGFKASDDTLPDFLFEPVKEGPFKGKAIDKKLFKKIISDYYQMQGWDKEGIPTYAKLAELDLDWINL